MKVGTSKSKGATSWFEENRWFVPAAISAGIAIGGYALIKWASTPTIVKGGGGGGVGGLLGGIIDAVIPL